jgi:hypothetical protein
MSLASMPTTTTDLPPHQAPRRARSPRATSRQVAGKPRKVSFYLSPEAIRRLGIAATMGDMDKSKVLETIIAEAPSLRRWVVGDRAKSADQAMPSTSAG